MTWPEPLFFKIQEVAVRWDKTEDDLLQLAAQGVIRLAFLYNGERGVEIHGDIGIDKHLLGGQGDDLIGEEIYIDGEFLYLDPSNIMEISATGATIVEHAKFARTYTIGPIGEIDKTEEDGPKITQHDREILESYKYIKDGLSFVEAKDARVRFIAPKPKLKRGDLLVLSEELRRFNDDYPELKEKWKDFSLDRAGAREGNILIGWESMAEHMNCSADTAKNRLSDCEYLRHTREGKPSIIEMVLNKYLPSGKKK